VHRCRTPTTTPTTHTSTDACALVRVERRGARSVVSRLHSEAPLGLRLLAEAGTRARVAIVNTAAMLIGGDALSLEVEVGPGAACELLEISATTAHPTRGEHRIDQRLRVSVGDGAFLSLREQPLIIAAATTLRRTTVIELTGDAQVAHREMLVLGRHDEPPGAACVRVRTERDGEALFDDTIDTRELAVAGSPAVFGNARVLGMLSLWGIPTAIDGDGVFELGPRDHVMRVLGPAAREIAGLLDAAQRVGEARR
jgi:urease accessory protein